MRIHAACFLPALLAGLLSSQPGLCSDSHLIQEIQPAASSVSLQPVILGRGWEIREFAFNDIGTVVLGGGSDPDSADSLIAITKDRFMRIAASGDPVPGMTGATFSVFPIQHFKNADLVINNKNEVAFTAQIRTPASASSGVLLNGLFLYSARGIQKVALEGEDAPPVGSYTQQYNRFTHIWMNDKGTIVFSCFFGLFMFSKGEITFLSGAGSSCGYADLASPNTAIFINQRDEVARFSPCGIPTASIYSAGKWNWLLSFELPSPGGVQFSRGFNVVANNSGDIVFQAQDLLHDSTIGLFVRKRDGVFERIVADGDLTPLGGAFRLAQLTPSGYIAQLSLNPQINDVGDIVFLAQVKDGPSPIGLFRYRAGKIEKIVADGDPIPQITGRRFSLAKTAFRLNNLGMVVFTSPSGDDPDLAGLFLAVDGMIVPIALLGDTVPETGGEILSSAQLSNFIFSDAGEVAFNSDLCCGSYSQGAFIGSISRIPVGNGGFEYSGLTGLPARWETAWANAGIGESFRYDSGGEDSFEGSSVLRLHVGSGGGATFVLSDAIAVSADRDYLITSRVRHSLQGETDAVFFTVIQYDAGGNSLDFAELKDMRGDSRWSWEPRKLLFRTLSDTKTIRVRFGLSSAGPSYLDVDSVR